MKKIKVAINGFGRIGRAFLKIAWEKPEIEIVAVTSNFIIASFVFAVIQYLFLIYLIFRLFKALGLPEAKLVAALSNLLLMLFFMVSFYSNDFGFTFYLVSNSYHTGAFLMSLLCTILALEYLMNSKIRSLIFLSLISTLSVFSDST